MTSKIFYVMLAVLCPFPGHAAENKGAPPSAFLQSSGNGKPALSGRITGAVKSSQTGSIRPAGASPAAVNRLMRPR